MKIPRYRVFESKTLSMSLFSTELAISGSFRATGITNFLKNEGTLEAAQRIAGHADSRTTKLYDRRGQKVLLEDYGKDSVLKPVRGYNNIINFQPRERPRHCGRRTKIAAVVANVASDFAGLATNFMTGTLP
jgi:hypothetical protein